MRVVVVCPGRGSYNRTELGSITQRFPDDALLEGFDRHRVVFGQPTIRSLDGAKRFSVASHTRGDNASALVFAASIGDFLALDRSRIEVVAVTGNSMGWYSALACAGAVTPDDGFAVANTMGTLMQRSLIGGQIVHPFLKEDWTERPGRRAELLELVASITAEPETDLWVSIDLGGMMVVAGNEGGLAAFAQAVDPVQQRYPMRLANHAAFHTPLMQPVADLGRQSFPISVFGGPDLPLVDGRGAIWWPRGCDPAALRSYTLGTQVVEKYDFTLAIAIAAREFNPDAFVVLGPGGTMGGAVAQSLVMCGWRGLTSKQDFRDQQERGALLLSMNSPDQRSLVARC